VGPRAGREICSCIVVYSNDVWALMWVGRFVVVLLCLVMTCGHSCGKDDL